jgi:hypothetical protein
MTKAFARLLVVLLFAAAFIAQVQSVAVAQSNASPTAPATADDEPVIWFVLGPKGQGNGTIFDIKAEPGQTIKLTASIGNGSSIPVKAIIYAADVYSAPNGGFAMKDAEAPRSGATTWLDFPTQTRDFKASEGFDQDFTVTVPADAAPGQYLAGLAIETAESRAVSGGVAIRQKTRLATAVLITVPGAITPGFAARDLAVVINGQAESLVGTIENTGNIKVRPEGDITLADASGKTVATVPVKMGSVFAHDATTFDVLLTAPLPEGDYTANGTLKDPETGATAEIKDVQVTAAAPAAPSPLSITDVALTPQPSLEKLVFLGVKATIHNAGEPVTNGQLTLQVSRDGKLVDERVLASSLTLVSGDTVVDQPYIPASGAWEPGTYQFQLVLAQADPASGAATTIGTFTVDQTITVP